MQPPDCPLSCSHTDHGHLRGPHPQGDCAERSQCGLDRGPGAAPHGSAHSHHHRLEAATEQRAVELQSECSPQQLGIRIPADPQQGLGHCRVCQGLLLDSHCPGKPRAPRCSSPRCSPQRGSAQVLSRLWWGGIPLWPGASVSLAGSLKAQLTGLLLSLAGTFPPTPANIQHLC